MNSASQLPDDTIQRLVTTIEAKRTTGEVRVRVQPSDLDPRGDAASLLAGVDAFAAGLGLAPIGGGPDGWHELSPADAAEALTGLLWKDLAYRAERMPHAEAEALARRFLGAFPAPRRCFTNFPDVARHLSDSDPPPAATWRPVTPATFDAAVVILGTGRIGIVCVADED